MIRLIELPRSEKPEFQEEGIELPVEYYFHPGDPDTGYADSYEIITPLPDYQYDAALDHLYKIDAAQLDRDEYELDRVEWSDHFGRYIKN